MAVKGTVTSHGGFGDRLRSGKTWQRWCESLSWYPFIIINLVVFVLFTGVPYLLMMRYSVLKWDLLTPPQFVGLGNFVQILTDPKLHTAIKNTIFYMVVSVPAGAIVSLLMAVLVQHEIPGTHFFRAVYYLPQVTSITVLALVYWRLFSPRADAPVNYLLGLVGVAPKAWFVDQKLAMPTVIGLSIWQSFGYTLLIWLAGLKGIPTELYDAADVDGASGWRLLLYITIPLLRPTAAFILMISTIGALQVFASIFLLTAGGPAYSTMTIVYYIYERSFTFNEYGYACAISIVLLVFILAVTLLEGKYLRYGEGHY